MSRHNDLSLERCDAHGGAAMPCRGCNRETRAWEAHLGRIAPTAATKPSPTRSVR